MSAASRFIIVAACLLLCAGALWFVDFPCERSASANQDVARFDAIDFSDAYQPVATERQPNIDFTQIESVIRRDYTAMSHRGRIEFGSVRVSGATAEVEVFFFALDGRVRPVLYKLVAQNDAWMVRSMQRMPAVPRSQLLRGLRV